ncbi:MAG: FtsX-like permease family protein, partial [Acetobacteraceae bacterium]
PGRDPVGQLIYFHRETRPTEVVGVAADSVVGSLSEGPVALAYLPLAQEPATALGLAVRTARPSAVVQEMRQAVEAANPQLAITQLEPAGEAIHRSLWAARMGATLLLLLAALATVLTAIGIYGVAAYSVRRRWRELGIRMALGARRGDVLALVLRDAIGPVLAGLILGIAGALALGRLAASLLFGMAHADPAIIAGYSALFLAVAALALLLPARQATGADPATIFKDAT